MTRRSEAAAGAALAVLLGGAAYEALVAFEAIPLGDQPGDGPFGGTVVLAASLLACLVASGACLARALGAPVPSALVWLALAPAGFAFTLARWYAFDPYYLPSLRRYSTNTVHGPWIVGLGIAALLAAGVGRPWPRAGALASAAVLLACALTAWWLPVGK